MGVALERQPPGEQRRAEVAVGELDRRDLVAKPDAVIAAREQPEIVALAVVLLAEHMGQQCPLGRQQVQIGRGRVADDLREILVLLDDDDDVVVARQIRQPGRRRPDQRRSGSRGRRRLAAPE